MKEYRLDLKVRNNRILKAIEAAGFKTVGEFCRIRGLSPNDIGHLVNCQWNPLLTRDSSFGKAGEFRKTVCLLAEALGVTPWDLFTVEQILHQLPTNKGQLELSEGDVAVLARGGFVSALPADTEHEVEAHDLAEITDAILKTLTPREAEVLHRRFGIGDGTAHTLEEVSKAFNVSRERIRGIESKALRKLRHPKRAKFLKPFLEGMD